ncbi:hypothetical protein MY1884_000080 [Beauveria asiatica]
MGVWRLASPPLTALDSIDLTADDLDDPYVPSTARPRAYQRFTRAVEPEEIGLKAIEEGAAEPADLGSPALASGSAFGSAFAASFAASFKVTASSSATSSASGSASGSAFGSAFAGAEGS